MRRSLTLLASAVLLLGLAAVHLDEACGAFLPGCHYCPWSSRLVDEVKV
ncbi:hypothetical protein GCM10022221_65790 [Actinocorallia aurea]